MTKIVKLLFFSILINMFGVLAAQAQTINAASCSASDVQAALSKVAADGTSVVIPSCPSGIGWSTAIVYNQVYSTTIIGQSTVSTINSQGNPSTFNDTTLILDNVNHGVSGAPDYLFQVSTAAGKSFRLSGISFATGTAPISNNGVIIINGASQSVRVDHCHFSKLNEIEIGVNGQIYGVFDHDLLEPSNFGWRVAAGGWSSPTPGTGDDHGDGGWADATTFGSNRFIFFENSTIQSTNGFQAANDCVTAGRFVARFSTFSPNSLQTHGTGHAGDDRGCRAWEIYKNTFNGNPNCHSTYAYYCFNIMFATSGTGLIWSNTAPVISGNGSGYQFLLTLKSNRRDNSTYPQTAPPNGWGYCGTSFNGTGSNWDQNINSATGYACVDQPGRGVGDLVSGTFPNKVNTKTGSISWVEDALEPVYEWLDSFTPLPNGPGSLVTNQNSDVLVQNQDFYLGTSNFNGTSGVGSGTLASRPSTCTTGVAYWATDQGNWNQSGSGGQGVLYKCTGTNTWTAFYTPYTYPHPLTQGTVSVSNVAPPSNLTTTVN